MISSATASATIGIQANLSRFASAADRISNPESSLSVENAIALKTAEHGIKANAAVLSVVNDVHDQLVDILA